MDFKGFHGFWTVTLFILATIAIQCRSEVYSLAQHLSAVCSSRSVMHHRCKKVNVKTCCHEEKCSLSLSWGSLTRWKLSPAATEIDSCCLSLMSCGCWCWQDETEKALPANAVSPVLPLPHPQKSLKDQLWDQWYDLWGRMLKVNFKGTMMDFFFFYVVDRTVMLVNLLFLPPVNNSSWLQLPTLEH